MKNACHLGLEYPKTLIFLRRCGNAVLIFIFLFSGCKSAPVRPQVETSQSEAIRNNCYSLLHQLLDQEKDVSILRFIKHENTDLKQLIKKVAAAAGRGAVQLEKYAKKDSSLRLDEYSLPPGENKTRDSISAMEQDTLLHNSGDKFEITLVLTQIQALNYAAHLAKVAGQNDFQPERARYLAGLSLEMENLHDEVVARLSLREFTSSARTNSP